MTEFSLPCCSGPQSTLSAWWERKRKPPPPPRTCYIPSKVQQNLHIYEGGCLTKEAQEEFEEALRVLTLYAQLLWLLLQLGNFCPPCCGTW